MLPRLISSSNLRARVLGSFIIILFVAPFLASARSRSTPPAPAAPQIQTATASIMLRLQREGAPVYDFRKSGQAIPGAIRVSPQTSFSNSSQLVLIGDGSRVLHAAQEAIRRNAKAHVYMVPSHFVAAYPDFQNVRQIAPRDAYELIQKQKLRVFDFAESEEFDFARVPGSTRIAWTRVLRNDWSALESYRGKTVLLICPVGSRSQIAAQKLQRSGARVLNVRGGMFAWQNAGLPVEGRIGKRSTHVAF